MYVIYVCIYVLMYSCIYDLCIYVFMYLRDVCDFIANTLFDSKFLCVELGHSIILFDRE